MDSAASQLPFQKQLRSYQQRIAEKSEALQQSQHWYKLIVEHVLDAIIRFDQEGYIKSWNPMAEQMFGYSEAEARGQLLEDILIPPRLRHAHLSHFRRHLQRARGGLMNRRVEGVALCKNGSELAVEFVGSVVKQGDTPAYVMVLHDISQRKAAEEVLRNSHANLEVQIEARTQELNHLASILEATVNFVGMADLQGHILYVNPAGKKMVGLKPDIALETLNFKKFHSPKVYKKLHEEIFPRVLKLGVFETNCEFLDQEGKAIPTASIFMSLPDKQGKPSRLAVIARDLRNEIALQQQIEHVDRLESLGILAGGIAHDFNNILTAIICNAGIAANKLPSDSPAQKHLHRIEQSSVQAANLCKQMLAYSGKACFVIQSVNLSTLIADMSSLLEVSVDKSVRLEFHLCDQLPAIDIDITQIQQIIMNLIINASEACPKEHGSISVSTGIMHVDKTQLQSSLHQNDVSSGDFVYLRVSDNGCGMTTDTRKKIFDPFFTTKFTGRGLGMSAVLGIVHGHQGLIQLDSTPDKGSTFNIALPISTSNSVSIDNEPLHEIKPHGSGTVLIIDDEETIREVTSMALSEVGFSIVTAVDGQNGIEVFQQQTDLVGIILDMTMPRMNGETCFDALHKIDPNVPVILSSGYSEEDAMAKFQSKGLAGFIQKPYKIDAFQRLALNCFQNKPHHSEALN
jgi:PAS domain S-box-containing protein